MRNLWRRLRLGWKFLRGPGDEEVRAGTDLVFCESISARRVIYLGWKHIIGGSDHHLSLCVYEMVYMSIMIMAS